MAIDTTGKWWIGSEATDLVEYLQAYSAEGYPVAEVRISTCGCGMNNFRLEYHADEGVARRTCVACGDRRFIADSEENWKGVRPKKLKCIECRDDEFNIAVGFSLYDDRQAVRWIYVGGRCARCGVLGCYTEWKIGYEPSMHLLEQT